MKPGLLNSNVTKTRIANIFVPDTSCIDSPDFQQQSYRIGAGTSILQEGNLVTCHPHPESAWLGGDLSTRESAAEHWAGLKHTPGGVWHGKQATEIQLSTIAKEYKTKQKPISTLLKADVIKSSRYSSHP